MQLSQQIGAIPSFQAKNVKGLENVKNIRQMPQDELCEKVVLYGVFLFKKIPFEKLPFTPDLFYNDQNRVLAEVFLKIAANKLLITSANVNFALKEMPFESSKGVTIDYLRDISDEFTDNYETVGEDDYQKAFYRLYEQRERRILIKTLNELTAEVYDSSKDIFETIETAKIRLRESVNFSTDSFVTGKVINRVLSKAIEMAKNGVPCVESGIDVSCVPYLDYFMPTGAPFGSTVVIGGATGMGKSTVSIDCLMRMVNHYPVGMINLELSARAEDKKDVNGNTTSVVIGDIIYRCWAHLSEVDYKAVRNAFYKINKIGGTWNDYVSQAESDKIEKAVAMFNNLPLYLEDSTYEINAILHKINRMVLDHGVKVVVVDYYQLIENYKKGLIREQQLADISRSLKLKAKELGILIIELVQFLTDKEGDEHKKPTKARVRDSKSIVNDASLFIALWRPDAYGIKEDVDGKPLTGLTFFCCDKNREGGLDEYMMKHEMGKCRYYPLHEPIATLKDGQLKPIVVENVAIPHEHNGLNDFYAESLSKEEKDFLPF